jgi:hypothetical protein
MKSSVFWDIRPFVLRKSTDVSEEHVTSTFMDEEYVKARNQHEAGSKKSISACLLNPYNGSDMFL